MGGGKKSKAPAAPNYAAAATAQGEADLKTAQYTTAMDRPNQYDPYGSVEWTYNGGSNSGPNQAALSAAQAELARAQGLQVGRGRRSDWAPGSVTASERNRQIAAAQAKLNAANSAISTSRNNPQPGDWRQTVRLTPEEQRIFDAEQANRFGLQGLASTAIGRAGSTIGQQWNPNLTNFRDARGLGGSNVGLPQYQADRVGLAQYLQQQNAPGMGADNVALNAYQRMRAAPGMGADNVALNAYQQQQNAPGMGADGVGLAGNTLEGLQDVNESADQFGTQGQQVRDALYQQMTRFSDERFGREEEKERTRLAQMGLQEGTRAYQNALSEFRRSKDESYAGAQLSSILAGGQEQSRMIADQLASRQSNIGLRQGQFGQNMARDQQDMAERLQQYQAGANQWNQNQSERQFGFNADVTRNQQDMAERLQQYQAGANQWSQDQSENQFGFNADVTRNQQDMAERLQQYNAAQNQWGQNQSERQFGFGADMARDAQDMAERMQQFQTGAQRYGMDLSEREAQATSELNLANLAAQQRQQQFSEQAYGRSLPINEISALLGSGNVNMPQFANFAPSTPFAAPDLLGATNAQYAAAMNGYNSSQSQKGGMLGAGAGMLGSFMGGKR